MSSGVLLSLIPTSIIAVVSIGFLFRVPLNVASGVIAIAVALVIFQVILKESQKVMLLSIAVAVAVVVISCLVAGLFIDLSWDGNAYHKTAIIALRDGWIPTYQPLENFDLPYNKYGYLGQSVWPAHYPEGLWEIEALIYTVCGNIELAKAPTSIASISAMLVIYAYCSVQKLSWWKSLLVSLAAGFNPILIAQFTTFYNDAFLMMNLLVFIVGFIILNVSEQKQLNKAAFILIACSFFNCALTKYTGILYTGVFGISYFIVMLWRSHKSPSADNKTLVKHTLLLGGCLLISLCVLGFSPYITNMINHGNPLYPLAGQNAIDIITAYVPAGFEDKSLFAQTILSLLSKANVVSRGSAYDISVGGFGVAYRLVFLVSIILSVFMLVDSFRKRRLFFQMLIAYLIPTLLLISFVKGGWWARYSSYLYFLNLFILFYYLSYKTQNADFRKAVPAGIALIFTVILAANCYYYLRYSVKPQFTATNNLYQQLHDLKSSSDSGQKIYVINDPNSLLGQVSTLHDADIDYEVVQEFPPDVHPFSFGRIAGAIGYQGN